MLAISYPTNEPKTYEELAILVLSKLEAVNGKYILVGESFSGPLSLFVSEARPKGLIGLVLVATFITAPNLKIGKFLPWKLGFSLTKPLYRLRLAISSNNKSLISNISSEMQKVSPHVLSARIKEIFAVNATKSLRGCSVPVVYFRGIKDIVVPKKNLKEILSVKPDAGVVEFNSQHFLLQSEPEKAVDEIRKFAKKCA